jgi:hypothetical protein
MRSPGVSAFTAAVGATAALALLTASAHASGRTECVGTATVDYDPPLTWTPQPSVTERVTVDFTACYSEADLPAIRAARIEQTQVRTLSCLTAADASSGAWTIVWNDRTTSSYQFTSTTTAGTATAVGTIAAGRFTGLLVVIWHSAVVTAGACLLPPTVSTVTGPARLLGVSS